MSPNDSLIADADRDPSLGRSMVVGVAVCMLMLGVVFRALAAGDFLWLDEQHTAWVANTEFSNVARRAADGNQTPLFFYSCWAAIKCGGESALSVRLPALVSGLTLMTIVALFIYRRTVCAASLLVVSVFFLLDYDTVFYASEARPYAMVQLLGAIQAACFFVWIKRITDGIDSHATGVGGVISGAIATAVLAAIIFYVHPTGMLLMVAELIFAAGLCAVKRKFPWKPMLATAALFGVLILPGVILISFVWQRRENWSGVTDPERVFFTLTVNVGLMVGLPLVALLVDRFLVTGKQVKKSDASKWPSLLMFVACWAVVPALLIAALDGLGWVPLAIGRYAIVGAVAFPIFAACAIGRVHNNLLRWIATALVVGAMVYRSDLHQQLSAGGLRHENWQEVVRIINAEDKSLPVFLVANLIEDRWAESDQTERFQQYLGFPLRGIPAVESPQRIVPRPSQGKILSRENLSSIADNGGGLVVVRDLAVYRDPIRLEILAALQEDVLTKNAELFAAPINDPRPNNVHLFLIKIAGD